ncbi:hypothetical protein L1049_002318 [Liquidambar formosana]|uniref:NAB domain-containing protein n=1 Tax=Liquidambar formosana TaxID=63359 RepID=A0AAP0R995_LIQFO
MENTSGSCSWGSDRPDSPHQSQWLQTTLSDLDKKMKAMLSVIEEDGDSLAHRVEMYYKKRPELIKMIEEFNSSYRSLAERYDQLSSQSAHAPNSGTSSPSLDCRKKQQISNDNNSSKAVGSPVDSKLEAFDSHPESIVEDPEVEFDSANYNFKSLNEVAEDLMSNEPCNMTNTDNEITHFELGWKMAGDFPTGSFNLENTWSALKFQVMKLMEENLQQQAELIRRNNEKRNAIKELRCQLDQLKGENRALQSCLGCSKIDVKDNRSQISTLKGLKLGKFFGCSP